MECPSCGTYNPEGRETCWRCDKELPTPKPQKKKDPQKSAQMWLYVAIVVFFGFTILQTCGVFKPRSQQAPEPTGHLLERPPIVRVVDWAWAA